MAAVCRRTVTLGFGSMNSHLGWRYISEIAKPNGRRVFVVDTLALVRKLESQGLPTNYSEAITAAMTGVQNDSWDSVIHYFVSKAEMEKKEMKLEASLAKFMTEIKSAMEHNNALQQHEHEKLKSDLEKMRNELRYEIDKVTAGLRLDLNLEKGRIRDELNNMSQETSNLSNKLDREISSVRAHVEATKYELIKYCVGTLVSVSAVGLAILRILL